MASLVAAHLDDMKLLFLLLGYAAAFQVDLDGNGQFWMSWNFINSVFDVELQVNCTGWTAISILAPDGSVDDIIVSGYNDSDRLGYIQDRHSRLLNPVHQGEVDNRQDVLLVEADYRQPWTVVRWQRSINTGDLEDVVLWAAPMRVGWAYGSSDDLTQPHDRAGVTSVSFFP